MEHFYQNIGEDWFTYPNLYKDMIYKYGDGSHFVEVGCWKGRSAAFMAVEIINSGFNIKFDCVDTWEGSVEHQHIDEIINKNLYDVFLQNTKSVNKIINPKKMDSLTAAKEYENESLDFVFIDASHEYEDVLNDIKSWMPKVKVGGTIAGHDYYDKNHMAGVFHAVNELFPNKNFILSESCWIHTKKSNMIISQ
jgi:cephalosporin hydroxylase